MKGKCATQRLALATFLARWGANRRASSVRLNQAESLHPTLRTYTFLNSLTKIQKLVSLRHCVPGAGVSTRWS